MNISTEKFVQMPVGVVVRKTPGVTRWAKWAWKIVGVIPGAEPAQWKELRREGEAVEYLAGVTPLTLYRTDTEAYLVALSNTPPSVYAVLRKSEHPDREYDLHTVTASAYEAQDYSDAAEDMVEQVPMPPGLIAWVSEFVEKHHKEEEFIKRKRRELEEGDDQDGIGDARIRQTSDVYRKPNSKKQVAS